MVSTSMKSRYARNRTKKNPEKIELAFKIGLDLSMKQFSKTTITKNDTFLSIAMRRKNVV